MIGPNDILRRAAELVELGWCRGHVAENAAGLSVRACDPCAVKWCAAGALDCAAGLDTAAMVEAWRLVTNAVHRREGHKSLDLVTWNDAPGRTQAEVAALLRECAL